jgi:hypothetical protein
MTACKHRVRELAPSVEWCSRCGAHRRLLARRWTRWIPCGVQRLVKMTTAEKQKQLAMFEAEQETHDRRPQPVQAKLFAFLVTGHRQQEQPKRRPQRRTLRLLPNSPA